MKANELQIDDLVLIKDEIRKVAQITKRKVGYHKKEKETRMHYVRLHDVRPIEVDTEVEFSCMDLIEKFPIKYLHQLQQVVRLMSGKELEVKL